MILQTLQVKNYKVVDDTGPVKVDPKVTALVGKNESGKTAILKSLWKSRNVAGAKFDKLLDYPRARYNKERAGTQEITELSFELSDKEKGAFVTAVPVPTSPERVILSNWYEGPDVKSQFHFDPPLEFPKGDQAIKALHAIGKVIKANEEDETTVGLHKAITKALEGAKADDPLWASSNTSALEKATAALTAWTQADSARESVAAKERSSLSNALADAKKGDQYKIANAWAEKNVPTFIYFDEYGQLDTQIHLPTYLRTKDDASDVKARTQTALFEWSGLDPKEILRLGRPKKRAKQTKVCSAAWTSEACYWSLPPLSCLEIGQIGGLAKATNSSSARTANI